MSKKKGGIFLLWIIAFGALGLSGYMFFKNELIAPPGDTSPDSGLTLVGLWDGLAKNKDYLPYTSDTSWLIEFSDNQFNNSDHISLSYSNSRFKLLKEGFYKITLLLLLETVNVNVNSIYYISLVRNSTLEHYFGRIAIAANPISSYFQIESSLYVKSTGLDYFVIRCYCLGDTFFTIANTQTYNQLSIEYQK